MTLALRKIGNFHYGLSSRYFNKVLHHVAKSTPGLVFDFTERVWVGYPDAIEVAIERCKSHGEIVVGTRLPSPEVAEDTIFLKNASFRDLYEYQKQALRFSLATAQSGSILGLDVGLGKSAVASRLARAFKEPTVIVGPAFASSTWEKEIKRWWPEGAPVYVLKGTKPGEGSRIFRPGAKADATTHPTLLGALTAAPSPLPSPLPRVVYANYSIIHAWVDLLIQAGYRTLILDECHLIQGGKARRTQTLFKLRESSIACIGLTGTPRPNFTRNLYLMCSLISPGRFGKSPTEKPTAGFFEFGRRYCGGHQVQVSEKLPDEVVWDFDGSSNEDELANRLRWFLFRRTKADVAAELPKFTRQVIELDVSLGKKVKAGRFRDLLKTTKDGRQKVVAENLRALLNSAADRKLPVAAEIIANHVSGGAKVVVYSVRRVVAEAMTTLLAARGVKAAFLHGGLDPERRQKRLADLRESIQVLCVTIDSMGVAVDLTFASIGVVVEFSFEPHELKQLEGRQHRKGQTLPVLYQYLVARGSADELVRDVVVSKLASEERLIGSEGSRLKADMKAMTTEQVLDELAQRILQGG